MTMWRVFREVDGVEELDIHIYSTQNEALARARERNAREEAGK